MNSAAVPRPGCPIAWRPSAAPSRCVAGVVAVVAATVGSHVLLGSRDLWPVAGVVLGLLLAVPWPSRAGQAAVVLPAFVVTVAAIGVRDPGLAPDLFVPSVSVLVEIVVVIALLGHDRLHEGREGLDTWLQFVLAASVVAPAAGAAVATGFALTAAPARDLWSLFVLDTVPGFLENAAGLWLVTPLVLTVASGPLRRDLLRPGCVAILVPAATVLTAALMAVPTGPPLLVLPLLVLPAVPAVAAMVLYGAAGTAAVLAVEAVVVVAATQLGHGPFHDFGGGDGYRAWCWTTVFLLVLAALVTAVGALARAWSTLDSRSLHGDALRVVGAHAGDLTFVAGLDGYLHHLSPEAAAMLGDGGSGESHVSGWIDRVHPDDRGRVRDAFERLRSGATEADHVVRLRLRDGSWRWFGTRMRLVPPAPGEPRVVVGVSQDMTETQEHRHRLERANAELERAASTDPLTGLPNRRAFHRALQAAWSVARRSSGPLSVLIVDIDLFKSVNDHYGHDYGDRCLTRVAGVIAGVTNRAGDLVARYGGEEFVVLLPGTGRAGALVVAERIRRVVRRAAIPGPATASKVVTVSIGAAASVPVAAEDGSLFAAADAALYRAKERGRDRVELAPDPMDPE